jgi:hypothetical protein
MKNRDFPKFNYIDVPARVLVDGWLSGSLGILSTLQPELSNPQHKARTFHVCITRQNWKVVLLKVAAPTQSISQNQFVTFLTGLIAARA